MPLVKLLPLALGGSERAVLGFLVPDLKAGQKEHVWERLDNVLIAELDYEKTRRNR
jgi:hypothetical protein